MKRMELAINPINWLLDGLKRPLKTPSLER